MTRDREASRVDRDKAKNLFIGHSSLRFTLVQDDGKSIRELVLILVD